MDPVNDYLKMLEMLPQPAFAVRDGKIIGWNRQAALCSLKEGQEIGELLLNGQEEYAALTNGCLSLQLKICADNWTAAVTRLGDIALFQLEQPGIPAEVKAMSLMSSQLRHCINTINIISNRISADTPHAEDLSHEVSRIHRMLNNASNTERFLMGEAIPYVVMDGCAILQEVLEESATLLEHAGFTLEYSLPKHPVFFMVDEHSLRQAMYNLLSNAAKFSPAGGTIKCQVTTTEKYLRICVTDQGSGVPSNQLSGIFTRYSRQPMAEDSRKSLGLGLALVRAVASAHGGTVLADCPKCYGLRITMTLALKEGTTLRSPNKIPVLFSRAEGIIMLSDALPPTLYKQEN